MTLLVSMIQITKRNLNFLRFRNQNHAILILFAPKSIVFDSTIKGKKLNNWLKACAEMEINAYSVYNSGAFVAHL